MIGWMRKNNRAACAARTLAHFFDVVFKIATGNFQKEFYKFEDRTMNRLFSIFASFGGAPTSLLEIYFVERQE